MAENIKNAGKPEKKEKVKLGTRIKRFFKDYKSELKKVVWPSFEKTRQNTMVVLIYVAIIGVIIWVLDMGFGILYRLIQGVKPF